MESLFNGLNIAVIKRQVERWISEFKLQVDYACVCPVNLQREFKDNSVQLRYSLVLISPKFPKEFIKFITRIDGCFDDDFINVYKEHPPNDWRFEWHVETASNMADVSSVIEKRYAIPLIENNSVLDTSARQRQKDGLAAGIKSGLAPVIKGGMQVVKWITENDLAPMDVTRARVQDFLFENGCKENKIFKEVWKNLPDEMKNRSGKPPTK